MTNHLTHLADQAVTAALKDKIVTGTSEVNEVARLVNALPKNLVHQWGTQATGAIAIDSVFTHRNPFVYWKAKDVAVGAEQCCELADLLLIVHVIDKQVMKSNALLVQVKKAALDSEKLTLKKEGDLRQRYLYANWEKFAWSSRGTQNLSIKLPTAEADNQYRYAVVRSEGEPIAKPNPGWWVEGPISPFAPPAPNVVKDFEAIGPVDIECKQTLGDALYQMYVGTLGRKCDLSAYPRAAADDWSHAVSHLYEVAMTRDAEGKRPKDIDRQSKAVNVKEEWFQRMSSFVGDKGVVQELRTELRSPPHRLFFHTHHRYFHHFLLSHTPEGKHFNYPPTPTTIGELPERGFGVIEITVYGRLQND